VDAVEQCENVASRIRVSQATIRDWRETRGDLIADDDRNAIIGGVRASSCPIRIPERRNGRLWEGPAERGEHSDGC
jgi:hypothetical protein